MIAKKFLLLIGGASQKINKFFSISLCFLLFWNSAIFPALVAGTLIKTSQGMVPIEALVVGNKVLGLKHKSIVETKIARIGEKVKRPVIGVKIDTEILVLEEDNLLYDLSVDDWVKAKNITEDSVLVDSDTNRYKCLWTQRISSHKDTYEVSLESPNTFFIHKSQILAHNMGFEVLVGEAMTVGGGTFGGGTAGAAVGTGLIGWLIYWLTSKGKWVQVKNGFRTGIVVCKKICSPIIKIFKKKAVPLGLKAATVTAMASYCVKNNNSKGSNKSNAKVTQSNGSVNNGHTNSCSKVKHSRKCRKNQKKQNKSAKKAKKAEGKNKGGAKTGSPNPVNNNGNNNNRNNKNNKNGKKERIVNTMSKTEFFHTGVGRNYQHDHGDYYKLKPGCKGVCENAEYIKWDKTHKEVEVFDKNDHHLGAFDTTSGTMYKEGKSDRRGAKK